jgi:hypothetical protein
LDAAEVAAFRVLPYRPRTPSPVPRRPWSAADDDALRAGYVRGQVADLAATLGRTVYATRQRARAIGLGKPEPHRLWTPDDDHVLRELHGVMPMHALASHMGRTRASLKMRVRKLGLAQETSIATRYARDQDEIARLRGEVQRLRDRPPPDAAHAPSDDARRLAVLVGYRMSVITPAEAAVVLGVPVERLPVELGRAAKRGLDLVREALGEGGT